MLKYANYEVTFSEVPDEITLCLNISRCPHRCRGCHSPYLAEDIGTPLNKESLEKLILSNRGITCVSFMGGDAEPSEVDRMAKIVKNNTSLKVCWYSGSSDLSPLVDIDNFDYIKIGPYQEDLGGLDHETTNQRFYKIKNGEIQDITFKFWRK